LNPAWRLLGAAVIVPVGPNRFARSVRILAQQRRKNLIQVTFPR